MKIKTLISLFVSLLFLSYFTSCDSSSYEIEEVEVYEDTAKVTANNEIKQEIEQPKADNKEVPKVTYRPPPVKFIIQIGAFYMESNALRYLASANNILTYEFTCQFKDGMHKVWTGIFDTKEEAFKILEIIRNAGFWDSFVTEFRK